MCLILLNKWSIYNHFLFLKLISKIYKHFFLGSWSDKKLYLEALRWSMTVRFWMVFVPFRRYRSKLGEMQQEGGQLYTEEELHIAKNIKGIVLSLSANTPWESKCMVQAVSCKKMLEKRGIRSTMYLGVYNDPATKKLQAHAWLKLGELILTGGKEHQKFKVVNFFG